MIHGRNLIVSIDGTPVAAAKSCTFTVSQDFLNTCSPITSRVFNKVPTTYGWSISVDGLIESSYAPKSLMQLLISGTKVLLTFQDNSTQRYAGFAYVKSCDQGGSVGSLATFSASFESDGELFSNWQKLTLSAFASGATDSMAYSNGGITYNFTTGSGLIGIGVQVPASGAKAYVWADTAYAVYNASFTDVQRLVSYESSSGLNEVMIACGDEDRQLVELTEGNYTIMTNIAAVTDMFILTKY